MHTFMAHLSVEMEGLSGLALSSMLSFNPFAFHGQLHIMLDELFLFSLHASQDMQMKHDIIPNLPIFLLRILGVMLSLPLFSYTLSGNCIPSVPGPLFVNHEWSDV